MSDAVFPRMSSIWEQGTLNGATFQKAMSGAPCPCTVSLDSTNGSRAIQVSTDGGINFFTPVYSVNIPSMLNVTITAPVTTVLFTGQAGDTWTVV